MDRPQVIYDGNCGFCKLWVNYGRTLTGDRIDYAESQERAPQAVLLVTPEGQTYRGAEAVFRALDRAWLLWIYRHVPGFEALYRWIAAHRPPLYRLTRMLWGTPEPPTYDIARSIFVRALATIYFVAFASFAVQAPGLIGSNGILPVNGLFAAAREQLGAGAYWELPGIFWWNFGDGFIEGACWTGAVLALVVIGGWLQRPLLAVLWVLYLSVCSVGQEFLGFQWDILLLEVGFLAIFLNGSPVRTWLFRWLLFRLMFMSGMVKLTSGDPTWRNLTALTYHYETQPLPNVIGWYAYHVPAALHRASAGAMFAIELVIPFLVFGPHRLRLISAAGICGLQLLIFFTGNYTFFNLLTIALCLFLLDDQTLRRWFERRAPAAHGSRAFTAVFTVFVLAGTTVHFRWLAPLRIFNSYGLFAVMTTERPEIVIEGSDDGQNWREYNFRYKPGDLYRAPRWVQPHQPRLDWQMWFAALGPPEQSPWFSNLLARLLEGSPQVRALLGPDPFQGRAPRYIRALLYDYRFISLDEHRATGAWWKRQLRGVYFPAVSLRTP